MIRSWKHKALKNFYLSGEKTGIIGEHTERIKMILQLLDAATRPEQLNLPGLKFHRLKGKLKEFYSITVRSNWRIIFQFNDDDAILVDYIDYH